MQRAAIRAWLPWITMGLLLIVFCTVVWLQLRFLLRPGCARHVKTRPVVCIDPGHPSETNSARHVENGTTELHMNWEMAQNVAAALARKGVEIVITKKTCDEFMPNHVRAMIANECGADLALHLHCDAGPGKGYTVYFPNKQGTIDGKTGPSPEVIDSSCHAAYTMHSGMVGVLQGWLHDRGVKGDSYTKIGRAKGTLTTSAFSEVPTLTVEMCFLTNRQDADFIESQGGQRLLTDALVTGVVKYLLANGYEEREGKLRVVSH